MNKCCRISGSETKHLFSLGRVYVSDFVKKEDTDRLKSELSLCFSETSKLLQLEQAVPKEHMYGLYWYRSGTNSSMKMALKNVVDSVLLRSNLNAGDVWLDIASNDGTLLSFVPKDIIKVGIDPADDTYKTEAEKVSDAVVQDYFSAASYRSCQFGNKKAKVITIIAMFYDLEDPGAFLEDIDEVMDDDGLLVLQMSYTPLMIQQLAFDNICHEHICYYSLTSLKYLLDKKGFRIVDCELNDVNGGSFCVYIRKTKASVSGFKTAPFRDVADFRVNSFYQYEEANGFNTAEKYLQFYTQAQQLKEETVKFIRQEHEKGKVIWGYGASTKGNTLLQWYELDQSVIHAIAERSPYKYGLYTVGSKIPIYSEEDMKKAKPDYLLILPWHFVEEFKQREREYLKNGGAFILPCPKFDVIRGN